MTDQNLKSDEVLKLASFAVVNAKNSQEFSESDRQSHAQSCDFESCSGNPAGVLICNKLPSVEAMQSIAKEINFSETVFSAREGNEFVTRYFSPQNEVPFCGHATIALGVALGEKFGHGKFQLKLTNGTISVTSSFRDGISFATLESFETGHTVANDEELTGVLNLFDLSADHLDSSVPAATIFAGAKHLVICVRDELTLSQLEYDYQAGSEVMQHLNVMTVMFCWRMSDRHFKARNFCAGIGIYEDPATGAAAAAFAGLLRDRNILAPGELIIDQGERMGRPCQIYVSFDSPSGSPVRVKGAVNRMED